MKNHFRTAVLTVILAGGTMASYVTAYTLSSSPAAAEQVLTEGRSVRVSVSPAAAKRLLAGSATVSVGQACATFEGIGARSQCMQDIAGVDRPVRVINFASTDSNSRIP